MTLINETVANSLNLPVHDTDPINVNGLHSKVQTHHYISVDIFILGTINDSPSAAKLTIEAHIIPELQAKVLIGTDVMVPEGFDISFHKNLVFITSCQNITCPIMVHAKPNHVHDCPVYATKATQIPPHSGVRLLVFVKKHLPDNQDFVYNPAPLLRHLTQYGHLVDANFFFIDVFNLMEDPIRVSRRACMGTLSDEAYSAAYEVDVFAADTFSDEPVKDHHHKDVTLTIDPNHTERILPNGVHVYAANDVHANALETIVQRFPIWGETEGFVNVPEDQWMEIPLIPGWESMVPCNKVYKQGPMEQ